MSPADTAAETIEVWCTKYALTSGVCKVTGNIWDGSSDERKPIFQRSEGGLVFHGDWHTTEAAAIDRVRKMVVTRQAALAREGHRLLAIVELLDGGNPPTATEGL